MFRPRMKSLRDTLKFGIGILVVSTFILIIKEHMLLLTSPSPLEEALSSSPSQFDQKFVPWLRKMVAVRDVSSLRQHPKTKWVVIDGIASTCTDVNGFTQHSDWGVVLVTSGQAEPRGCRSPHCILLNEDTYGVLMKGLATTQLLSKPTKLSGYLLAMSLGADVIMDAKCGTPQIHTTTFSQHPFWAYPVLPRHSLFYNETNIFNPFQHFGHHAIYPNVLRDLSYYNASQPLNQTDCYFYMEGCKRYHTNSNMYYIKRITNESIWQSVSTLESVCATMNTAVNSALPHDNIMMPKLSPVSVGQNTVAPLEMVLTLFPRSAFPLMFLPMQLKYKIQEDLFRTLFVHGMKSCNSIAISYVDLDNQDSNPKDLCDREQNQGTMQIDLSTVLLNRCSNDSCAKNISNCAIIVAKKVVNALVDKDSKFTDDMKNRALILLSAWLRDLSQLKLLSILPQREVSKLPRTIEKDTFKMKFSLQMQYIETFSPQQSVYLTKTIFDKMHSVCEGVSETSHLSLAHWISPLIRDVALVIVLNYEFLFETLTYLEYLYRSSFQYVIYCGPNVDQFNVFAQRNGFWYVTFIDGFTHGWHFMYECMTHVMKLGLPVKGYLQIGDDVLLNMRKLASLSRNRIWMPKGFTTRHLYRNNSGFNWYHWKTSFGKSAIINIFTELESIVVSGNISSRTTKENNTGSFKGELFPFAKRFLTNYRKNIGRDYVLHRAIDFFYIPEVLREEYIVASELFRRHTAIIELAVPVIHLGLVSMDEVLYLKGASLWNKDRRESWKFYNESASFFIHPFKSLSQLDTVGGKHFFCLKYLPKMKDPAHSDYGF